MSKLKSRKFWMALISVAAGIMSLLNFSESTVSTVSGLLLTLVPTVTYIVTEGKIDAASLKNLLGAVSETLEAASGEDKV